MKVGIMTFHRARNCGAVIQCFALQNFLRQKGFDAVVFDYIPQGRLRRLKNFLFGGGEYRRNCRTFAAFRKKYLTLSRSALPEVAAACQAVISGSDQVWNLNYAQKADGSLDLAYFLDFITGDSPKRIAYAASAGNGLTSPKWQDVKFLLQKFSAISVREPGLALELAKYGISASVVADPTFLLVPADYRELISPGVKSDYFGYLLKENLFGAKAFQNWSNSGAVCQVMPCEAGAGRNFDWGSSAVIPISPGGFLSGISGAKKVLTDSFHGTVFSLLFNRPFVTLVKSTDNGGGNERLANLLEKCGLSDRLVPASDVSIEDMDKLLDTPVDWERVNDAIADLRLDSGNWLVENLK